MSFAIECLSYLKYLFMIGFFQFLDIYKKFKNAIFRIKKITAPMHLTSCIALLLLATSYTIQLTDHHACMHANLNITLLKINRNSQLIVYN